MMSEQPETFKRIYVEKAPIQLTPELYSKLLEDGYIPEELREHFWAILSPTQAMVFLDDEYMVRWKARARYLVLFTLQLHDPARVVHEDLIDLEQVIHMNEMYLLRARQGFERSIMVGRIERTYLEQQKKPGFLARLFGRG